MKKKIITILFMGLFTLLININISNVKADNIVECIYKFENVDSETIIRVNTTQSNIISAITGVNKNIVIDHINVSYSDIMNGNLCTQKNLYYASGRGKNYQISLSKITGDSTCTMLVFKEQRNEIYSNNLRTCSYKSTDCFGNTVTIIGDIDPQKRNIVNVTVDNGGIKYNDVDTASISYKDIFYDDGTCRDGLDKNFALYFGIGSVGAKITSEKNDVSSAYGYTNICAYSAKTDVIVNDEPNPNDDDDSIVDHSTDVSCGETKNIPKIIPQITNLFFNFVKILTPIILIIKGMIDIFKAVTAAKEDEISKAKSKFFKRLVPAIIVFLIVLIAQIIFGIIGTDKEASNVSKCLNCFLNNECELNIQKSNTTNPISSGDTTTLWSEYQSKIDNSKKDTSSCGNNCRENSEFEIVKVVNGVFYYIGSTNYNGQSLSKGTGQKDLNIIFSNRLNNFFKDAENNGYKIWVKYEGWRSLTQQKYFYCCYTGYNAPLSGENGEKCSGKGTCNNGNQAANPGTSNHGYGLAADLGFCTMSDYNANGSDCSKNEVAVKWAHNNASKFGLKFNNSNEDWHIVPYDMVNVTK